jgi:hypothetical protein
MVSSFSYVRTRFCVFAHPSNFWINRQIFYETWWNSYSFYCAPNLKIFQITTDKQ